MSVSYNDQSYQAYGSTYTSNSNPVPPVAESSSSHFTLPRIAPVKIRIKFAENSGASSQEAQEDNQSMDTAADSHYAGGEALRYNSSSPSTGDSADTSIGNDKNGDNQGGVFEDGFEMRAVSANGENDDTPSAVDGDGTPSKKELRERKKVEYTPKKSGDEKKSGNKKGRGRPSKGGAKKEGKKDGETGDAAEDGEADEEEEEEYEVERILDHKKQGKTYSYLVRWLGYGPEFDTWEPEDGLDAAKQAILQYKRQCPPDEFDDAKPAAGKKRARSSTGSAKPKSATKEKKTRYKEIDSNSSAESGGEKDDEEEEYGGSGKKGSKKPRTKAEVKAFAAPAKPRTTSAHLVTRQQWLTESGSSSSDEESKKKEDVKSGGANGKAAKGGRPPKEKEKSATPATKRGGGKGGKVDIVPDNNVGSSSRGRAAGGADGGRGAVEGIYRKQDGEVYVVVGEQRGGKKILSLKDAFDTNGWNLVQYLVDRTQFA